MDSLGSSASAREDSSSGLKRHEGEERALEEMANFFDALQDFQMRISDDLSQRISSSPPGLRLNQGESDRIGSPEIYRDEYIERGLLKISESTEELQKTLNMELVQIRELMKECPQSVSYVELSTYDLNQRLHSFLIYWK